MESFRGPSGVPDSTFPFEYQDQPAARPPSPVPSYHTLPPNTHTTIPESSALTRAALETPDLPLSLLHIHNVVTTVPSADALNRRVGSDNVTSQSHRSADGTRSKGTISCYLPGTA